MKVPEKYRTKPSDLEWARYLGPVKWRDYDPPQYFNFRAYLDFGGGQITDLFTHWIDVVHMFLEQDNPIAGKRVRRRVSLQGRPHGPGYDRSIARIPGEWTATFEATLAPGLTGAAVELVGY